MQRARRASDPDQARKPDSNRAPDDPGFDLSDVPAAVVCASCGEPDCPGCLGLDEPTHASGVVAIVPWERPGLSTLARLWATARLATLSPRDLFSGLPDGGLAAPLAFAVLSELIAVAGLVPCFLSLGLLAPDLARMAFADPELRALGLRMIVAGVPSLVAVMVVLHALHGVVVDRAARRAGSTRRGRGLRFGLYACGWDLVTLPLGLLVLFVTEGPATASRAVASALTAPTQATRAYLSGLHALSPERARRAARSAGRVTVLLAIVVMLVLFGILVASFRSGR